MPLLKCFILRLHSPNVKLLDQTSLPIGSVKTFMMTTTLSTASVQTGKINISKFMKNNH